MSSIARDDDPTSSFRGTRDRELERRFSGSSALSLSVKALLSGGVVDRPGLVEWDCSGDCRSPVVFFTHEIAEDFFGAVKRAAAARRVARDLVLSLKRHGIDKHIDDVVVRVKRHDVALRLSLTVRCRRCERCLDQRRRLWTWRAVEECEHANRSWFGTLTLRPDAHDYFRRVAQRDGDVRQHAWEELSDDEKFLARHRAIGGELTRWLKRVRKNSGAVFRYLLVAEAHVSGLPHYHFLLHEVSDKSVKYDVMKSAWRAGFVKINLISDKRSASYVCKYLGKSLLARVRASQAYGASLDHSSLERDFLNRQKFKDPHLPLTESQFKGRPIGGLDAAAGGLVSAPVASPKRRNDRG